MKYSISTNQELEERFWQIPEDLQGVVIDEKIRRSIDDLARKNGVNEALVWLLSHAVFDILMAVEPIKGFAQRIVDQLGVAPATAQKIADEINENIFRPVRQSLIKIHEIPPSEQAEIPATEIHFEHLLEIHSPGMIALAKPATPAPAAPIRMPAPTMTFAPKTLAEQKMSRSTSLPPQISHTNNEPDPYREPLA